MFTKIVEDFTLGDATTSAKAMVKLTLLGFIAITAFVLLLLFGIMGVVGVVL